MCPPLGVRFCPVRDAELVRLSNQGVLDSCPRWMWHLGVQAGKPVRKDTVLAGLVRDEGSDGSATQALGLPL